MARTVARHPTQSKAGPLGHATSGSGGANVPVIAMKISGYTPPQDPHLTLRPERSGMTRYRARHPTSSKGGPLGHGTSGSGGANVPVIAMKISGYTYRPKVLT